MHKLYFATTNPGKITTITKNLQDLNIEVVPVGIDIPEPRSDETRVIAKDKVLKAFDYIKKPCIAQDGGFYIPALNGFPKAYVKFAMETIGVEGILTLLKEKPREAEFCDTLAYMDETLSEPILFEAITKGVVLREPVGELHEGSWGELHHIFQLEGTNKALCEMTVDELEEWRRENGVDWCGIQFADWMKARIQK